MRRANRLRARHVRSWLSGGFAVHAADDDSALSLHDGGERFARRAVPFLIGARYESWMSGLIAEE